MIGSNYFTHCLSLILFYWRYLYIEQEHFWGFKLMMNLHWLRAGASWAEKMWWKNMNWLTKNKLPIFIKSLRSSLLFQITSSTQCTVRICGILVLKLRHWLRRCSLVFGPTSVQKTFTLFIVKNKRIFAVFNKNLTRS